MKKQYIYFGLVIFVILLIAYRKPVMTGLKKLPRGLRNKNPGNIRLTKTFWQGEVKGTDKSFKTFISMEYGYRAIFVLLRSYINKGFDTIEKILNRYAPPSENVTSRYIVNVSKRTGISPNKKLSFNETENMKKIVAAISRSENGVNANLIEVEKGFNLVGI